MPLSIQELSKTIGDIIADNEMYGENAFIVFVETINGDSIRGIFVDVLTNQVYKFELSTGTFEFHSYLEQREQEEDSIYNRRVDAFSAGFSFVAAQRGLVKDAISNYKNLNNERIKSKKIEIKDIKSNKLQNKISKFFKDKT